MACSAFLKFFLKVFARSGSGISLDLGPAMKKKKRGYMVCSSGYAATDISCKRKLLIIQH
jgi:hypothetical protein